MRFAISNIVPLLIVFSLGGAAPDGPAAATERGRDVYSLDRGPLKVKSVDISIHDAARNKDLELRVRVPIADAKNPAPAAGWPLVVFSHGAGGSRAAFGELLDFWASHGYASIAPTHADSLGLHARDGDGTANLGSSAGRRQLRRDVNLGERVADCKFILDSLAEISRGAKAAGAAALEIDRQKIGIAGHSAGAFTAQLCAGVKARAKGIGAPGIGFQSIGDERFKAAIIISGQGTASLLLGEESWASVKVPLFVITGSLDNSPPDMGSETPETRQHPFTHSRGTDKGGPAAYLLFIEGATHSSYAGKATSRLLGEEATTDIARIQSAVATGTTVFLDAWLRGSESAKKMLKSDRLRETIPGKVRYEHK